jgi:hypothetical protein
MTEYTNEGYTNLAPNTPANGFNITLDIGSQPAGVYQVQLTLKQFVDGGILSVTATTTSGVVGCCVFDTYCPETGGGDGPPNCYSNVVGYFNNDSSGAVQINFTITGQNVNSIGYNFGLCGNVAISQLTDVPSLMASSRVSGDLKKKPNKSDKQKGKVLENLRFSKSESTAADHSQGSQQTLSSSPPSDYEIVLIPDQL